MTLWKADALAEHHFPRTYLFAPIVPRDGIVFFYGKRNIGKSHVALGAAISILHGGYFYGRYPTTSGVVCYVQADMGPELEQLRVLAAQKYFDLKHLHFWFPTFLNLPTLHRDEQIVNEIRAANPAIIIWDTLRKVHRLPSNDDDTPSWVYGAAKRLFPHCAHWFIHHDKKTQKDQKGNSMAEPDEEFRGSGAWIDDCDTGIHITDVGRGRVMLDFTKVRSAPPQPSIPLTLNPESLLFFASGENLMDLAEAWREQHPAGTSEELEQFLLASFIGNPRIIKQIVYGEDTHE